MINGSQVDRVNSHTCRRFVINITPHNPAVAKKTSFRNQPESKKPPTDWPPADSSRSDYLFTPLICCCQRGPDAIASVIRLDTNY